MNTMPKLILAILFFTLFSTWTHGQTLSTQAEVDAWDQSITDIWIVTISGDDITNIDALSNVTSISGFLNISNNAALPNIDGLINVTGISGSLNISSNESLTNIDGLSNLTEISGSLGIQWNATLTNIDGLSNLTEISGSLGIQWNAALTNIDGLFNVIDISGSLDISNNAALTNIGGLSNMTDISGSLTINDNDALTNIGGLSNMTDISGRLTINDNDALTNIGGLSNMTDISGRLTINDNDALTNINGLSNVTDISGSLNIERNAALTNIDGLINVTNINGSLWIRSNVALPNIDGLINVTGISGSLNISSNESLTNFGGLINVTDIGTTLIISNNVALTNIDGLSNVTAISGSLAVSNNVALTNIDGLSNVTDIGGLLTISNNVALTNIDGLSNVTAISGSLTISNNVALTNIDGLSNVTAISGHLSFRYNFALSECCILRPHLLSPEGSISIWNNKEGCNSGEDILSTDCGLVIDYSTTPPCIGLDNGVIDIFASNYDTIPFDYIWTSEGGLSGSGSSQEDVFSIDGLGAGAYSITVTQPNGEEAYIRNMLLDPIEGSAFEITNITSTNSANGFDNGSLDLEFSGGVAPFELSWSGPSTGNQTGILENSYTIMDLGPGGYTIFIYDANGLSTNITVTIIDESIPLQECSDPMDIIILNLVSFAIDGDEYAKSKRYFNQFFDQLDLGSSESQTRVAIAEWSGRDQQQIRVPLTGDIESLYDYKNKERSFTSSTDVLQAFQFGNSYLETHARPDAQKVMIFTFDGCTNFAAAAYAEELKDSGLIIADIGIDYANNNSHYRNILKRAATKEDMAYFAPNFDGLDPLELYIDLLYADCKGSSVSINFDRDGEIVIDQVDLTFNCPYPQSAEITFTVSALDQLSLPQGTPVSFYHNDPTNFGATYISTFVIPCSIPAGESETFTTLVPIATATHLYALLNDNGSVSPSFDLPVTNITETTYSNNIDDEKICVGIEATIQALKNSVSLYPLCEDIVQYTIDVCNISDVDGYDISIEDVAPEGFVLVETQTNTNGCAEQDGTVYDIPAGCCLSMTLSYDVSGAAEGYYGDQGVLLSGPTDQIYLDFDGTSTSAENVLLDGTEDCGTPVVTFSKMVSNPTICVDHSLAYTFTIENKSSIPLYNVEFIDILPEPLEWVYKPYEKDGLSIKMDQFLEGQNAIFTIDKIEADTVASFIIDVYVGHTDIEVMANNTARIENLPDFINGGIDFLESNTTTTTVLSDIEILLIDTIVISAHEDSVNLSAVISTASNIEWTSTGDGGFSDPNISNPLYTLGAEDKLDSLIGLFISVDTYCGEKGMSLVIEREPCLRTTLATAEMTLTCNEQTATLEVESTSFGSQHVFAWYDSLGELIGTGQEYETDEPGLFTIEITDTTNTCVTVADFIVDDVRTLPDTTILSTTTVLDCKNESLQLSIDQEDNVIYTWTLPDSDTEEGNEIQVDIGGMVTLQATDTLTGCTNSSMITITEDKVSPVIDLQETGGLNCRDTIVEIDGTNSAAGEVTWLDSDKTELAESTNILEVNTPGIYYYHLVGTENGCEALDSITVTANYDEPSIDLIDVVDLGCEVDSILVTPTVSSNNGHTINWTYEGQDVTTENDLMASASGLYYIEVQDEVSNCKTRDSVRVNRPDEIQGVLLSQVDPLCFGEQTGSIEIQEVIGGTADFTYYFNDNHITDKEIDELSAGTYTIKVEDAQGCDFDTIITLIESEKILANINLEEYTVQSGQDVEIRINTNIDEADISTITWSPDIDCDNCSIYTIENITSNKTYTITVQDHNGCEESIEVKILVDNENTIHLPNILSIHEGNNMFYPKASGDMSVLELSVYDRWGNEVFRNENFAVNDGTNGWIIGTDSPYVAGVYVYYLLVQIENDIVRISGDVTLLR